MTQQETAKILRSCQKTVLKAMEKAEKALHDLARTKPYCRMAESRAMAYWLPTISGMTGQGNHVNPYDVTMETTIKELNGAED